MGASRKLQGEIDRVLKKVQEGVDVFDSIWNKVYDTENANQKEKFEADLKKEIKKLQRYRDQIKTWIQSSEIKDKKALLDARKLIEREMERFKVCEKETKTKAFSKEGLGLQPKTDPKEKAKAETRDWLNNVVGELESQVDNFEAELEGLFVKKGKTRPPRLTHLETSILRHKAHIMKLELILRLLDNDELSPEQVNDVKDFLEDYVERNQEDFDDFADVDDLYSTLPLDKVESLEDLVSIPPGLVKSVSSVSSASGIMGLKSSIANTQTQLSGTSIQEHGDEMASQDIDFDVPPKTPSSKNGVIVSVSTSGISSVTTVPSNGIPISGNISSRSSVGGSNAATILSTAGTVLSSPAHPSDDKTNIPVRKPSPVLTEIGLGRSVDRSSVAGGISIQASSSAMNLNSTNGTSIPGSVSASIADIAKRSMLDSEERAGTTGLAQSIGSPLSSRTALQQIPKTAEAIGSIDLVTASDSSVIAGRSFSPSTVSGAQWRPQTSSSFQNPTELGQFRGRPEIAPDQREKFLQRLQQVQQQTHGNLLGATCVPGFNSQNTSISPQIGQGSGVQASNLAAITTSSLQQLGSAYQQPSQHAMLSSGLKDSDTAQVKGDDQQLQQYTTPDVLNAETNTSSGFNIALGNEDDPKASYVADIPAAGASLITESTEHSRDTNLSPGQPIQLNQSSSRLGVIGRRSVSDLGAIGENLGSLENSGVMHDHLFNLQMLEAAYYKLPQPKDSERPRNYVPKHPAVTPASYPQVQAPIIDNPAFWDRLSVEPTGIDVLFFAFYYQQNTYQQYLAARELKRQSWRYHRKYNTWFQRHEEPKVTTDDYEQGTYVYFDFHNANDESQHGWCQRIKTEFTFEYSFLEDELVV